MAYREQQTQAPSVYVHLDGIETHLRGRQDTLDEWVHLIAEEATTLAAALLNAAANIAGNQRSRPQSDPRSPPSAGLPRSHGWRAVGGHEKLPTGGHGSAH
jgi:hypothetical protein